MKFSTQPERRAAIRVVADDTLCDLTHYLTYKVIWYSFFLGIFPPIQLGGKLFVQTRGLQIQLIEGKRRERESM